MTAHKHNCQMHLEYHTEQLRRWWPSRHASSIWEQREACRRIIDAVRMIRTWQRLGAQYD